MSSDAIIANLRKQKGIDEDFIVSKTSNFHVITRKSRNRKITHYFSDKAHAEIFLLASVVLGHVMNRAKVQRTEDFAFGFTVETINEKVVAVSLSPVLYNLITEMKVAMEAGQDCIHELIKYIS